MTRLETKIRNISYVSLVLLGMVIIGIGLIFTQLMFFDKLPENFGVVGDAIGGVLNPIIGISASLLTFLAFYMQKIANDVLKNQFNENKKDEHSDFIFNSYKSRIMLIINEVNDFNVSFHNSKLITGIDSLTDKEAKKYNFVGIQAITIFLIEYFRDKKEKELNRTKDFNKHDSYHAILLHINNLIINFYNTFKAVNDCNLNENYKIELEGLLQFVYYSKFNYFIEIIKDEHLTKDFKSKISELHSYYSLNSIDAEAHYPYFNPYF